MATSEILNKPKTAIIWKNTGGDHVLTLTSVTNGNGRKGDVHDFGAVYPARARWQLKTKFGTGPTAGNTMDLYWASSTDNSDFDSAVAAGDGAVTGTTTTPKLFYIGSFVCENNTNAQIDSGIFTIPARYGYPVIINSSGQTLSGTASDHELEIQQIADEAQ